MAKKVREERNYDDECLPEDILFQDILVRLPIKPLLRFKSVSKRWRYLIQSPSFVTSHCQYHFRDDSWGKIVQTPYTDAWKHPPSLYDDDDRYPTSYSTLFVNLIDPYNHPVLPPEISLDRLKLPYPEEDKPWTRRICVFGPLNNGIYCIVANLQHHIGIGGPCPESIVRLDTGKIAFCNPGTREYKFANPFPSELVPRLTRPVRTSDRQVNYGFGSVDKDGTVPHDYKVVVVLTCKTSFLSIVYSHRRGTWETLVDYELGKRDIFKPKAIDGIVVRTQGNVQYPRIERDLEICPQGFFNGCWHWMAWKPDDRSFIVLSFHMGNEVFKFFGGAPGYLKSRDIPGSVGMRGSFSESSVSVLNHHLAAFYLTSIRHGDSDFIFDVWMMMEYGVEESWTKIYTIQPMCPYIHKLVGITTYIRDDCIGGIQIEKVVFREHQGKLISCDDSVVENHGLFDVSSSIYWNTLGFSAYSQTLERVNIAVEGDDGAVSNFSSSSRRGSSGYILSHRVEADSEM